MGTEREGEEAPSHSHGLWSQLLPPGAGGDVGQSRSPIPCSSCSLTASTAGPGTQSTTYLSALQQQALEGRPELSLENLLQLPGQCLSGFPGALSREGGKARPQAIRGPTSAGHLPGTGRQPDPQSRRPTAPGSLTVSGQSDIAQSPLPTSAGSTAGL